MSKEEYSQWPSDMDIPLLLSLATGEGSPATGKFPQVSIRRTRETHGAALDSYYWNGTTFVAAPYWFNLTEVDPVNSPGLYSYLFEQSIVGLENIYSVYYRHTVDPIGFAVETHVITNELFVPETQPDPVFLSPSSIMGQLETIKGLLHHNSILDNQTFAEGQLTSARLRMIEL